MSTSLPTHVIAILCLSSILGCSSTSDQNSADLARRESTLPTEAENIRMSDQALTSSAIASGRGYHPSLSMLVGGEGFVAKVEVKSVGVTRYDTWSGEPESEVLGQGESRYRYRVLDFEVLEVLHYGTYVDAPSRLLAPGWVAPAYSLDLSPADLASDLFQVGDVGYVVFGAASSVIDFPYQSFIRSEALTQSEQSSTLVGAGMLEEWWEVSDGVITGTIHGIDFQSESELRSEFADVLGGVQ